jgi:serine/alanine adding enzyme
LIVTERFLSTADAAEWQACLPASRSVFGSLGYARIGERFRGATPRLHVLECSHGSICSPTLLYPLNDLPFEVQSVARWDAGTPDYTGPISTGHCDVLHDTFRERRNAWAHREGIVTEFAHLHPWSSERELLGPGCIYNREIVWVDVTLEPERIFNEHFESSSRKNVRKAEREGVKIFTNSDDEHVREFFRIYTGTMQRNQALDRYAFSFDFFRAFRDELGDNAQFTFASFQGTLIAATLYLHDNDNVYSYLGGADADWNHLRPTNLMIWQTIQWAHSAGKKRFILGGGYVPNDGIFRFKSTFSPLTQSFYTYRHIHMPDEYAKLEQSFRARCKLKDQDASYFPIYRSAYTPA